MSYSSHINDNVVPPSVNDDHRRAPLIQAGNEHLAERLDTIWQQLISEGIANSTRKQYASGQRRFIEFCDLLREQPFPASEVLLLRFVAANASRVRGATIQNYLSAIRFMHIANGFPNPMGEFERLRLVTRALKKRSGTGKLRAPVTVPMLNGFYENLDMRQYNDVLFWVMVCAGFFGFLRVSEFTVDGEYLPAYDLNLADLSFRPDLSAAALRVKASKTDPFRRGADVIMGATGDRICPVSAFLAYVGRRSPAPGVLFRFQNGKPVSRTWFSKRLTKIVTAMQIVGKISSHSLRIGAATAAANAGVPENIIQILGRWASDAYKSYVRLPRGLITSASRRMLCYG